MCNNKIKLTKWNKEQVGKCKYIAILVGFRPESSQLQTKFAKTGMEVWKQKQGPDLFAEI